MTKDAPGGAVTWQEKQREYEVKKARAKALKLRLTCTICGDKAKLNCPCGTTQYCSVACQKIDWRERGHRKACKKIRDERAAEAARAEAPTPPSPPKPVVYGPAPRSHADEIRARIAAEHEAARARREANPEPVPLNARWGSRCPVCLDEWDVNDDNILRCCCCRMVCRSCESKISSRDPCPLCRAPAVKNIKEELAQIRRHVENDVPEAIKLLGDAYCHGHYGLVRSAKKVAAKLYKRAVELGDISAMVNLGSLYGTGEGVKMDMRKATQLTKMASDRGDACAQCNFANGMRMTGKNEEALRYYRLSADQGFTEAEFSLGLVYMLADCGAEVDNDEAARWFARAASKGHRNAAQCLSELQDAP